MNPAVDPGDAPTPSRGSHSCVLLGLVTLALAGGLLGPLSQTTYRMGTAAAYVLMASGLFSGVRVASGRAGRFLSVALVPLAGALLIVHAPPFEGPIVAATLAILAVMIVGLRMGIAEAGTLRPVIAAGMALNGYTLLTDRCPSVWVLLDRATRHVTSALGRLSGSETSLGPSVAGIPVLTLVFAYLAARFIDSRRGGRTAVGLSLLWVLVLAAVGWSLGVTLILRALDAGLDLAAISPPGEMPVPGYPASVAVFLPLVLFAAWLVPTIAVAAGPARGPRARPAPHRIPVLPVVTVAALFTLLAAWPAPPSRSSKRAPVVLFPEHGKLLGWEVPSVGVEGLDRAGMFGLLPYYLKSCGIEARRVNDVLSPESLASADVVVVINPTEPIPAAARARLETFVSRGGGLVVLGDHTDLLGSRDPLNQLLEPYGVSFRFDSAFTPGHWHNDAGFFPGPLTRGLDDADNRFQQSTGASLELRGDAVPVATARWGFSDAGDHANKDNAFLGDYIYQAGEPLGDLPVVARARHGQGRVIVFGDTSAFQNIALPYSWEFATRMLRVAADRGPVLPSAVPLLAVAGWFLVAAAAATLGGTVEWAWVLAGTLAGLGAAAALPADAPAPRGGDRPLALVDAAHFNAVSLDVWDPKALTALNVNLARNGYLAIVDRDGDSEPGDPARLEAAEIFVSVAPRKPFSRSELDRLRAFMERGGRVVVALGWDDKAPAGTLLAMAGLDVSAVPLGPVPVLRKINDDEIFRRLQMEPHFAAAWPVTGGAPGRDEILYASGDYPVVVRRPVGRGSFTLVGDSRFLLNRTLEEEGTSWQGNVAFLRRIFEAPASLPVSSQALR